MEDREPICTGDTAWYNFFSYLEFEDWVYPSDTVIQDFMQI